jgi:predicted nucleic acid-binding Zn ribbon protein
MCRAGRALRPASEIAVWGNRNSVSAESNKIPTDVETTNLACSKCGATLPEDAQFCLKCGKPVSTPPKQAVISGVAETPGAALPRPKRKRRILLWTFVVLALFFLMWVATSDNPWAAGLQELGGLKHDQSVLETEKPFSVAAHSFRFYKFALPEGSMNVSIVGQFSAAPENHGAKANSNAAKSADTDSGVEVYVLSEPAFTVWQKGYATSSVYESGKVQQGSVQADLPAGAGIYYLVFSNKADAKTNKDVNATILLRYKSWVPEWFRRFKEWFVNWTGL